MTKTSEINVGRLYVTAVNVSPIERDWSEGYDPDGNGWTYYEAVRLDDGRVTDGLGGIDYEYQEEVDDLREGPMMNYAYPLPHYDGDVNEDAREIVDLPLCIVEAEGNHYLALTGGGMDLSWEICEAYMRLGYLPPAHFADLPAMAGMPRTDDDRAVMAACLRTAEVLHAQADRIAENIRRMS